MESEELGLGASGGIEDFRGSDQMDLVGRFLGNLMSAEFLVAIKIRVGLPSASGSGNRGKTKGNQ